MSMFFFFCNKKKSPLNFVFVRVPLSTISFIFILFYPRNCQDYGKEMVRLLFLQQRKEMSYIYKTLSASIMGIFKSISKNHTMIMENVGNDFIKNSPIPLFYVNTTR